MLVEGIPDISQFMWQNLASRAELPCSAEEFFAKQGPSAAAAESRRRFHRFHFRTRAMLWYEGELHAVYARDVSRQGIGFLAPRQLFPCDRVKLILPEEETPWLVVRRCRRMQQGCYEIGTEFEAGALSTTEYKHFVRRPDG